MVLKRIKILNFASMKATVMTLRRYICFILFFYAFSVFLYGKSYGYEPTVHSLPTRHNMPVANVNAVIQDREGYIWYATYEGGLCRDNGYQIDVFRKSNVHPDLLTDNVIYSLCECSNGEIWFSTMGCVYCLTKKDYSIRPVSEDLNGFAALEIQSLPNGNMLLMGDTLKYEVSPSHKIVSRDIQKYTGRRRIVKTDDNGGQWVCRVDTSLCYIPNQKDNATSVYNIRPKNILLDNQRHRLFAITPEGLQVYRVEGGSLGDCEYTYSSIPELGVFGLYLDRQDCLWMTGYQPSFTIFAFDKERDGRKLHVVSPRYKDVYVDRIIPLSEQKIGVFKDVRYYAVYDMVSDMETLVCADTVSSSPVWRHNTSLLSVLVDDLLLDTLQIKDASFDAKGHLWVVFDQFLREYNVKNRRFRDITVLGCGLSMNNFCCVCPVEGGVCVGGAGGVCFFPYNRSLDQYSVDVPVCISSYAVSSDDVEEIVGYLYSGNGIPSIEIDHTSSVLTLFLTSFDYVHSPNVRFSVSVDGLAKGWVTLGAGENSYRLVNLPKGDYRVFLRATDENGLWGDSKEVLLIHRLPAWWETWWAYTIYVLLALCLLTGIFLLYRYVRKKREQFDNLLRLHQTVPSVTTGETEYNDADEIKTGPDEIEQRTPEKLAVSSVPSSYRELVKKAMKSVHENIDNETYTVETLASALCMSRVNLYRKMMAACGQTPSEFIRTLRMEEAYRLLTTTDIPVNIVAGKCGFTSSSYFAKCFKSRYGILPTNVRQD